MELGELTDKAEAIVSILAALGLVLLLPLYLSQRRDVRRLRIWMERDFGHAAADLAASEALLDRAEAELEQVLGETAKREPEPAADTGEATAGTVGSTPAAGLSPATRVATERPALERITVERAALEPHPRWRRFVTRATQPRVLIAIGIAAVLLGAAAIFGSERLLRDGDEDRTRASAGAVDPAEVEVAVLNGTAVSGLAGNVGADVTANGFQLGNVTNSEPGLRRTVVMFRRGQEPAARRVARSLGVEATEPIGTDARRLAGDADVVVVAGEDRARP